MMRSSVPLAVLCASLAPLPALAGHVIIFARADEQQAYSDIAQEPGREVFRQVRLQSTGENSLICYEGLHTAIDVVYELAFAAEAEAEGVEYRLPEGSENEYFRPITVRMHRVEDGAELGTFVMPPCS